MSPADPPAPGAHPDHDLLADLAADVLPEDIAVQIQGHVMSCPDCADLLAEAEGIRALLRRSEPETMPDDVLDRLEATLVAAHRAREQGQDPATVLESASAPADRTATPAAGTLAPAPTVPTGRTGRTGPISGIPTPASSPAPGTPAGGVTGATRRIQRSTPGTGRVPVQAEGNRTLSRLRGRSLEATGARRQAREEERADEPGLLSRLLPAVRIAAVVVLVLGLGGLAWHAVSGGGGGSSDTADSGSAASAASPPVLAPVESTSTNYTKSDLQSQVKALVAQSQQAATDGTAAASAGSAQPKVANGPAASSAAQDGSQLLRSQSALRSCLDAIGAGNDQPVAVDLARYAGQEAAIIVLNGDSGGYEVWVVARTCAQGADGTIDVVPVASS